MQKRTVAKSGGGSLAKGIGAAYVSALLLLFAYSLVIEKEPETIEYVDAVVVCVTVISAVICGAVSCFGAKGKRGVRALTGGIIFSVIIVLLAVLINIDSVSAASAARVFLCGILGALLGRMMPLGKSNKKLRKRNK